ncbi:hypothetical protein RchiOBHm_Chr4g0399501 [Rosa chinensis]|uniref:Uncharacterized protein n=1 Tax=Rosa chinensis TaxID=74649 RepID=A0A2P6QSJ9_ROSCH|nr:hypothetical protein RchiOBHm_Chr4g0399501 [Rosa chinensis]
MPSFYNKSNTRRFLEEVQSQQRERERDRERVVISFCCEGLPEKFGYTSRFFFFLELTVSNNISTPTSALADYQEEKKRRRGGGRGRRRRRRRGRREETDPQLEQKLSELIIPGVLLVLQFGV